MAYISDKSSIDNDFELDQPSTVSDQTKGERRKEK